MTSWRTPELDESAADAVALMALYITGAAADAALANDLLDDLTRHPDGVARTIGGLSSLCAALLTLYEFDTGVAAVTALRRAALVVDAAVTGPPSLPGGEATTGDASMATWTATDGVPPGASPSRDPHP